MQLMCVVYAMYSCLAVPCIGCVCDATMQKSAGQRTCARSWVRTL
jgi:hypothetical protein